MVYLSERSAATLLTERARRPAQSTLPAATPFQTQAQSWPGSRRQWHLERQGERINSSERCSFEQKKKRRQKDCRRLIMRCYCWLFGYTSSLAYLRMSVNTLVRKSSSNAGISARHYGPALCRLAWQAGSYPPAAIAENKTGRSSFRLWSAVQPRSKPAPKHRILARSGRQAHPAWLDRGPSPAQQCRQFSLVIAPCPA